jgi:hypothetical protein
MKIIHILPAALLALACGGAGAADHLYQLNGNLNDSLGGPALTANGGTLGASAYSFQAGQGLMMGVSLGSVYTIDMSFHFDALGGYQKIIDFSNLVSDNGVYAHGTAWSFYPVADYATPALVNGTDARLTITRDASALVNYIRTFDSALSAGQVATLGPVPEPASVAMLMAGLALLAMVVRRKQA